MTPIQVKCSQAKGHTQAVNSQQPYAPPVPAACAVSRGTARGRSTRARAASHRCHTAAAAAAQLITNAGFAGRISTGKPQVGLIRQCDQDSNTGHQRRTKERNCKHRQSMREACTQQTGTSGFCGSPVAAAVQVASVPPGPTAHHSGCHLLLAPLPHPCQTCRWGRRTGGPRSAANAASQTVSHLTDQLSANPLVYRFIPHQLSNVQVHSQANSQRSAIARAAAHNASTAGTHRAAAATSPDPHPTTPLACSPLS